MKQKKTKTLTKKNIENTRKNTSKKKNDGKKRSFLSFDKYLNKSTVSKNIYSNTTTFSSFSPHVNKELNLKSERNKSISIEDSNNFLDKWDENSTHAKIYINDKLVKTNQRSAVDFLRNTLKNEESNLIDIDKMIGPKQIDSNCWFNTLFMSIFVSDKGRKFFKFFRYLMIIGYTKNGYQNNKQIPSKIWDLFGHLNLAISAVLSGHNKSDTFDSNTIIQKVHDSIIIDNYNYLVNVENKEVYVGDKAYLPNVGDYGYPLHFLKTILSYLSDNSLGILFLSNLDNLGFKMKHYIEDVHIPPPDIVVHQIDYESAETIQKEKSIILTNIEYTLDSAIILDTTSNHFACFFTYKNKECVFDGDTNGGSISEMQWKHLLNEDENIHLNEHEQGQADPDEYKWNFKKGSISLMYYRTK
jgi:hypothetical protein